jgi:hypothetical protein
MAHISKESSFSNVYTSRGFDSKGDLVSHLGQPLFQEFVTSISSR